MSLMVIYLFRIYISTWANFSNRYFLEIFIFLLILNLIGIKLIIKLPCGLKISGFL
jgi:hypothetical protein